MRPYVHMARSRCAYCKKRVDFSMACKYCQEKVCTTCLMPEYHDCAKICQMKKRMHEQLSVDLNACKCVAEKISKI